MKTEFLILPLVLVAGFSALFLQQHSHQTEMRAFYASIPETTVKAFDHWAEVQRQREHELFMQEHDFNKRELAAKEAQRKAEREAQEKKDLDRVLAKVPPHVQEPERTQVAKEYLRLEREEMLKKETPTDRRLREALEAAAGR